MPALNNDYISETKSALSQIKSLAGDALDPRAFGFIDSPTADGLEAAIIALKNVSVHEL